MSEECIFTYNLVNLELRAMCKIKCTRKLRTQFYSDTIENIFINEECLKENKWTRVL